MDRLLDLRLTDPDLDFWIDLRLGKFGRAWMAVADLAGTPEVGVSTDRDVAILYALWPLGATVAQRMVTKVRGNWADPVRSAA